MTERMRKGVFRVKIEGEEVPNVVFQTRIRDNSIDGDNPYRWQEMTTDDYFKGQRVVVFSLPGAFTPTCSTYQLPGFESMANEFAEFGINNIYCMSVNDSFVMNAWAKDQGLQNVKVIPDGSGLFTNGMGMLVTKDNLGFGQRSWRYAMIVEDGVIEKMFIEPGKDNNISEDPYGETSPTNILAWLKENEG